METTKGQKEVLRNFYRDLCISFVGCLRALSLYPQDHPETQKKVSGFFQRLRKYLDQRPTLTFLFIGGEVVVENTPLPELRDNLKQFIAWMEAMKFQRLLFKRGISSMEFVLFLRILLPLLKNPDEADLVLARNQGRLPHVLAGTLPFETGAQVSYEELSSVLKTSGDSALSFSDQCKDLFEGLEGPLSENQVSYARETTETLFKMVLAEEAPLKMLIYRRSTDPDPYVHAVNVAALSMALALQLELDDQRVQEIGMAGLLHDIGLHVPLEQSFSETATLSIDEKRRYWDHPVRGAEILLASPGLPDVIPVVAYEHHLHYDGSGYPKQERVRELNLASMITCVTDTYDNLRRNRPGKKAMAMNEALNWMDRQKGTHFHPLLVKRFRALLKAQAKSS